MTRTISVSGYTRRLPEKAPDPFATLIEAKKPRFAAKWGVELVGTDDERLRQPIPAPAHGPGRVVLDIAAQLLALAKTASRIGRAS